MTKRIRVDFSRLRAGEDGYQWGKNRPLLGLTNRLIDRLSDFKEDAYIVGLNDDNCTVDLEVPNYFDNAWVTAWESRTIVTDLEEKS